MPLRTDQSGYKGAVEFLTDLSNTMDKYTTDEQQAIKNLCKAVFDSAIQTNSIQFTYRSIKDFFNELNQNINKFNPDKQKKIKDLCKMVIGPGLADSQLGTTEDIDAVPTISRSFSNEDLTQTKLIQTGLDSALKILDGAAKEALPEDKAKLRKKFKVRADAIKKTEIESQRTPYFAQRVTEEDFAALNTVEQFLPDRLKSLNGKIVDLTGEIAKSAVNVKNKKEVEAGRTFITQSYEAMWNTTSQFLTELDQFMKDLERVSEDAISITTYALQLIEEKKKALLKFSESLAIERSNLKEQKKANRTLSYIDRGRLLGGLAPEFPPAKQPETLPDKKAPGMNEANLSEHFKAIQNSLSSSDEMIVGLLRKTMGILVAYRHLLNDGFGNTKGLPKKMYDAEEKYPSVQAKLQEMINELCSYAEPLISFKETVALSLKNRSTALLQQRNMIVSTFKDLEKGATELKALIPECTVELKTL